jgi:hypothetical protein
MLRTSGQAASGGQEGQETLRVWIWLQVRAQVYRREVGSKAAGCRCSYATSDEAGNHAGYQYEEMTGR